MATKGAQICSVCGRPVGRDGGMPVELVRASALERVRCDPMEEIAAHRRTVDAEGEGRE